MVNSEQPCALYEQIKRSVIRDIDSGRLKPDDRVPSETRLAEAFGASRMTANRALKELTDEKRIVRIQGVGTFVARPRPEAALLEIKSIASEIRDWGGEHSAHIICLESAAASPEIAGRMGIGAGVSVFHSIMVHRDRGVSVQYSERWINPAVAPDFLDQDYTRITPSDYLLEVAPVQEAEHEIEAILPGGKIAGQLEVPVQIPCLRLTRRTWAQDQVATFSRLISPGSRYSLKGRFSRQ